MEAAVLAGIGLICLGAALWLVAEVRRQIREMTEILEEIQKGNTQIVDEAVELIKKLK